MRILDAFGVADVARALRLAPLIGALGLWIGCAEAPPEPSVELPVPESPPSFVDGCTGPENVTVREGEEATVGDLQVSVGSIEHDLLEDGFDVHVALVFSSGDRTEHRQPSLLDLPQGRPERLLSHCVRVVRSSDDGITLEIASAR